MSSPDYRRHPRLDDWWVYVVVGLAVLGAIAIGVGAYFGIERLVAS